MPIATSGEEAVSTSCSGPTKTPGCDEAERRELATQKAQEFFDREIKMEKLATPVLDKLFPTHEVYKIRGYSGGYPYPMTRIVAIGCDCRTFELPKDFNLVISRENLQIEDKGIALELAKAYMLLKDEDIILLGSVNDIPWKYRPDYAEDPVKYSSRIKKPQVSFRDGTYYVEIYTWRKAGGEINRWAFEIRKGGEIAVEKYEIASSVGDYEQPVFR